MSHCHTILQKLREKGFRITPQRELIIQAVAHSPRHITAEEVAEDLKQYTSAINLATVYRTLDLLWKEGYAWKTDLSEGKSVYSTFKHGPHIHLVCRKCDQVIDADTRVLNSLGVDLDSVYEFQPDLDHFSIFGICHHCRV
jgi:Fur family ferric uptake transcriptional regulator